MKYAGTALAALVVLGFAGCSQNFFHGQKDTTAPSSGLEESLVPPVQSDHNQLNSLQADKVTTDAIVVLRPDFDPSVYRYSVYAYNSDENGKISITVTPGTHATSTIFLSTDDGLQYNETASGTAIPVN
ncbi:MAG: hypothetical protein LBD22_01560, partial [Spirochaetaceae bacterium]|nr:hypothetical protein [Spirochaetaceae bacterium]